MRAKRKQQLKFLLSVSYHHHIIIVRLGFLLLEINLHRRRQAVIIRVEYKTTEDR